MFALIKKRKGKPQRCIHQRDASANPETSTKTENPVGLPDGTNDTPEQSSIEKYPALTSDQVPKSEENLESHAPCPVCKEEKRAARRYRLLLTAGLFLPFTVQALDATIIAGALPFIASDFRKYSLHYSCLRNSQYLTMDFGGADGIF